MNFRFQRVEEFDFDLIPDSQVITELRVCDHKSIMSSQSAELEFDFRLSGHEFEFAFTISAASHTSSLTSLHTLTITIISIHSLTFYL